MGLNSSSDAAAGGAPKRRLPEPVYFVCRDVERWRDLFAMQQPSADFLDSAQTRISTNESAWIVLTYLYFRGAGYDVTLTDRPQPGRISVVSSQDIGVRGLPFRSFIVGCRGDGARAPLCDLTIAQNEAQLQSSADHLLPMWPQPKLVPRDPTRGDRVEIVGFKGDLINLYEEFRTDAFRAALAELGVQLVIDGRPAKGPVAWHDYTTTDVVLAVRDLTVTDALGKPSSKLVNAWTAGVPAVLGPEPAFQHLVRSPLDYIEVRQPAAAIEAIRRLKSEPGLYRAMVDNGRRRAQEFTVERTLEKWVALFSGPIVREYERWRKVGLSVHAARFPLRVLRHREALATARWCRHHGHRLVSDRLT